MMSCCADGAETTASTGESTLIRISSPPQPLTDPICRPPAVEAYPPAPFSPGDVTTGSELELHAVVEGLADRVDLPLTVSESGYYRNLKRRSEARDTPKRVRRDLDRFLQDNPANVWDQSQVRIPLSRMNAAACRMFEEDLRADKSRPGGSPRTDCDRFLIAHDGSRHARVPVSYLLKLALADAASRLPLENSAAATARRLMNHFLNDHCSPESFSFYVTHDRGGESPGQAMAREAALRFLLTQVLAEYGNRQFGLIESGQRARVYFSPNPALRQKHLNECVPDTFYRELFSSPCLSGWDQGESKHRYMRLCHEVLSRSRLNAVAKIRDAGLIASSLVLLPSVSDISLANNGVHITLGSRILGENLRQGRMSREEEKCLGDLSLKLFEHFIPLFIGTYSAAPQRIDWADFHAERVLGFLPHELDFTHLRMFWRRWKIKARGRLLGMPVSPSGLRALDGFLGRLLIFRGDLVPDNRLLDYLIAPLSTDRCPALDGAEGNIDRLKRDLTEHGIFDTSMPLYALVRLRRMHEMGFSGFEGRFHSLFESFFDDLAPAVDLQVLITQILWQKITRGELLHTDVPDDPTVESERRQVIFGGAVGLPTFYVRRDTPNRFLRELLAGARHTRASRRYPGYQRVLLVEYHRALAAWLKREAAQIDAPAWAANCLEDLEKRLEDPSRHSASTRLVKAIRHRLQGAHPLKKPAACFNLAAESFYREDLRLRHVHEALDLIDRDRLEHPAWWRRFPGVAERLAWLREDFSADLFRPETLDAALELLLPLIDRCARLDGLPDTNAEPGHAAPVR